MVVPVHLREVVVVEARQELGEEVVDRDHSLIRQIGEVERIVGLAHGGVSRSVSSCAPAACRRFRSGEHLQVELFIERRDLALSGAHEQLTGHGDEDAVIAGGMIDEGMAQLLGHQGGIAGTFEQMIQARQQFVTCGEFGRQSGTDARAERDQLLAPQLVQQPSISGEHDTQQGLGVEAGARQKPQLI